MAGLYLHIPFCASRCIYCGFYSTTLLSERQRYVDALCREMHQRKDFFAADEPIETIYLGGGTPSQLEPHQLEQIFNTIDTVFFEGRMDQKCQQMEITMEANPDDITPQYAAAIGRLPISRVSMGAQTFNASRLQFLRRRHTPAQVAQAVDLLRKQNIQNISIDLIFGFPEQSLEDLNNDIDNILKLNVEHISCYSLTYEEDTLLKRKAERGEIVPISEDDSRLMYETIVDRLEAAGYEHYEISNFGKIRSRHNSSYWNGTPYLGIGAAAHSYNRHQRRWNVANVAQYMAGIETDSPRFEAEDILPQTAYNDTIVTALRTREGIATHLLPAHQREYLLQTAKPFIRQGLLRLTEGRLSLTREGLFISDGIMAELLIVDE